MANTTQKKIKFSKGMVSDELIERTDLSILESSCLDMTNYIATVHGGFRSRRGTEYLAQELMAITDDVIPYDTVNSCMGTSADLLDDSTTTWSSGSIGQNRILCDIDYGAGNVNGGYLALKNFASAGGVEALNTTSGTGSLSVLDGVYSVMIAGGGAGAYGAGTTSGTNKCWVDSGGSGAGFYGQLRLKGDYTYSIGAAGNSNNAGQNSVFTDNNDTEHPVQLIVAGGGQPGGCGNLWASGGAGGILSLNVTPIETTVARNGNNGNGATHYHSGTATAVGAASVLSGQGVSWGASPTLTVSHGTGGGAWVAGVSGSMKVVSKYVIYPILVEASSDDGTTWQQVGQFSTGATGKNLRTFFIPAGYSRVRLRIDVDANISIPDAVTATLLQLINTNTSSDNFGIKLEKFYFNTDEKYLLVFSDEQILIFNNDELMQEVNATGLKWQYLKELKTAVQEDTMILTHPDMPPKQLQRTLDANNNIVWTWSDFTLKNIPYHAFGGTTETTKTVSITPSTVEGTVTLTASSAVFNSGYVGQFIDGGGGRMKITAYTDSTHVSGYTIIPFYTTQAIGSWKYISGYEAVWSTTRGWPRTCLFAGQRLFFGGSRGRPSTIWGSRVGLYNDFMNAGNYDNDAIDADLNTMSAICNLVYNRGLHIFTTGEEMTVSENALTPDTFTVTLNTGNGSLSYVDPAISSGQVLFIEKNGKSLLSYIYNYDQAAYQTDNINILSDLISAPLVMDIEVNSAKDKGDFLYIVLEDGRMLVDTLCLPQEVKALSQFTTDGLIKDVCCVRDTTYLLVRRGNFYYLEKLADTLTDAQQSIFIDSAQTEGLTAYIGKMVHVWSDSADYGTHQVGANGVLELNVVPNEQCHLGIEFNCRLKSHILSVSNHGASVQARIAKATIVTKDTPKLTFNGVIKYPEKDGVYQFFASSGYSRRAQFEITSTFSFVDCLSVVLNMNYGRM